MSKYKPKENYCLICGTERVKTKYCKKCKPWVRRVYTTQEIMKRYGIEFSFQEAIDWMNEYDECIYCKMNIPMEEIAIDHIMPKSRGGNDHLSNLQVIHKRCNMIKGAMTHEEFIEFGKVMAKLPKGTQKIIETRLLQSGFMFRR